MYYNPPALKHLVFSSWENIDMTVFYQRRSHDFSKGVTLHQTEGTHQIFVSIPTPCFT